MSARHDLILDQCDRVDQIILLARIHLYTWVERVVPPLCVNT